MDKIISATRLLTILLSGIAMFTPWIQLRHSKGLTGKELSQKHPELEWVKWGFISMYLAWIPVVILLLYKIFPRVNSASLVAVFIASLGLFSGGFAVITSVSILPIRSSQNLYTVGDEAREAGRFQVAWSVGVIAIAVALELFYR
jgi:hypothetical protein